MRRSGVPSTHHERPHFVTCRFQFIVYPVISSRLEARDVLKTNPIGSHFAHQPQGFKEQSCSLPIDAFAFGVRGTGVLAGRRSDQKFRKVSEIVAKLSCGKGSNVVIHSDRRPALGVGLAPPRIDLASRDDFDPCAVKSQTPATGRTAKEIERLQDSPGFF